MQGVDECIADERRHPFRHDTAQMVGHLEDDYRQTGHLERRDLLPCNFEHQDCGKETPSVHETCDQ